MLALVAFAVLSSPKTMATSISSQKVQTSELVTHCWHDGKSGYFLYSTVECDGSHRSITLTKDRRLVGDVGFNTARFGKKPENEPYLEVKDRALKLVTSNGISIGMTPDQVRKKLGKPTLTATRGKNNEFWCAMYKKVRMNSREEGQVLRNSYVFKNSKLIEITINLDSVPGCGDDSLSDEGWPWTRF